MRQRLGKKKIDKLSRKLNLPIKLAHVRGNTDHRIDLYLEDGMFVFLYKDGTMEKHDNSPFYPPNYFKNIRGPGHDQTLVSINSVNK